MQRLIETIDERAAPDRRDALSAFARVFLRRLTDEDLPALWVEATSVSFGRRSTFTDDRGLHPSAVRVFDPEPETDGYRTVGSVIETNTDDSPFLVDSVSEELQARGLGVRRLLHPVVGTSGTSRDGSSG